jgi:C4-dicarboxylate-specific signal transduction histidine kinase
VAAAHAQLLAESEARKRVADRVQELQSELFHAARLSAAGQMAAALAHELNQPLAAITNSAHAARRLLATSEAGTIATLREIMDETSEQALRAGHIIRRLREFVTRRKSESREESVTPMIEEASALALAGTDALGMRVQFRFDPAVSVVFANRIEIQQVLVNLIRNAIEAMTSSVRRELLLTTVRADHRTVAIGVADSGSGLAPEIAASLFEPFVSTRPHGMGIGLAICQSIVEAHGGQIAVRPNEGGGTVFWFTLPARDAREEGDAR